MIKKLTLSGLAVVVSIGYYFWLIHFHIGIPCVFHKVTGLLCPGCGVTHMFVAMLHLEFKKAYASNSFLFLTQPLIYYMLIKIYVNWLKNRPCKWNKWENCLLIAEIIGAGFFFFWRNFGVQL